MSWKVAQAVRDARIGAGARKKLLLVTMALYGDENGFCHAGVDRLAAAVETGRRVVEKDLAALVQVGKLRVVNRGGGPGGRGFTHTSSRKPRPGGRGKWVETPSSGTRNPIPWDGP